MLYKRRNIHIINFLTQKTKQGTKFYTRVNNLSHITFTRWELNILNFGFQYNTEKPITPYITDIAIETENAIKLLHVNIQGAYRVLTATKLKEMINSCKSCNHLHKRQLLIIRQLKNKLISNNLILKQAKCVREFHRFLLWFQQKSLKWQRVKCGEADWNWDARRRWRWMPSANEP